MLWWLGGLMVERPDLPQNVTDWSFAKGVSFHGIQRWPLAEVYILQCCGCLYELSNWFQLQSLNLASI